MDFDTIFTVLFIIIIVLFQIFGAVVKKVKQQAPEASKKKPGIFRGIRDLMEQVQEEMAAARESGSSPCEGNGSGFANVDFSAVSPLSAR